jgi:ergothioneine biosynthesis protein EgtB
LLSRPSLDEVRDYRAHIDAAMTTLMDLGTLRSSLNALVELGLNHEQQHQELILTDVLHMLSCNPLKPAYAPPHQDADVAIATPLGWLEFDEGVVDVGHDGSAFAFDNESPRHRQYLNAFSLASRAVTNGEYLAFLDDAGYRRPELWLSEGWDWLSANSIDAPLYWQRDGDRHGWLEFGLRGLKPVESSAPVCHVSLFEADAYARWADARLPSESEWEVAASGRPVEGNFIESGALAPRPADAATIAPAQLFGDVWEWTQSAYAPYPGYRPAAGAIGEYNGKFMCNQYVLRGGSCVSPTSHLRATYRNFFPASARWQFTGIRLARDSG